MFFIRFCCDKVSASLSDRHHYSLTRNAPLCLRDCSFPVDDTADHAETPFDAYRDIEPFLFQLGLRRKRPKAKVRIPAALVHIDILGPDSAVWLQVRIYDPYYCEGSVSRLLVRDLLNLFISTLHARACVCAISMPLKCQSCDDGFR
eukprot:COSAG04_NODE_7_length_45988_cov_220.188869_17_plen_147_part_00